MTFVAITLAIALLGSLAWAIWLRQRLSQLQRSQTATSEQPSSLMDAVASALDAGLVLIDHDRQVRYVNPQAEELLGAPQGESVGEGLIALIRDYQVDALVNDVLRDLEPREIIMQPLTGHRTLRVRAAQLSTTSLSGVVLLIRDITQITMLERARRDMVANVSHELRTPLASVKLLVETLETTPPPQIAQRMLGQMAQEVDAITQLVDELHELSQIEAGRVVLQLVPSALAPVVARTVERIRPQVERKVLRVVAHVADSLPPVLIDADRIGQVLLNLLHNAVKFTPSGGEITVRAFLLAVGDAQPSVGYSKQRPVRADSPSERQLEAEPVLPVSVALPQPLSPGDWILVTIADNGVGIPTRDLPRIFERFYKVDRARTRNAGGTGLGLAIAKHLIEGHGGRIWAASEEGKGSTFYLALPVA